MKYYKDAEGIVYLYEADGSQDSWIKPGLVRVSEEEGKRLLNELNKKREDDFINSKNYAEKRALFYPSIGDQLDDLFKAGYFSDEMASKIQAVKDKYPKN